MGIEKLEAAVGAEPELLVDRARDLVGAYLEVGNIKKAEGVVERMLSDAGKHLSVDDRAWGYGKRIELALMRQHAGAHDDGLDHARRPDRRRQFS